MMLVSLLVLAILQQSILVSSRGPYNSQELKCQSLLKEKECEADLPGENTKVSNVEVDKKKSSLKCKDKKYSWDDDSITVKGGCSGTFIVHFDDVRCGTPPNVTNAHFTDTGDYIIDDTVTYECDTGFAHDQGSDTIDCTNVNGTGVWETPDMICVVANDCGDPPPPSPSNQEVLLDFTGTLDGDTATYACEPAFLHETITCVSGTWTSRQGLNCADHWCNNNGFWCNTWCMWIGWACDGWNDCGGIDEAMCPTMPNGCLQNEFRCENGNCMYIGLVCNGGNNCNDGEDEVSCTYDECFLSQIKCADGGCISAQRWCDGNDDCEDGSDELNCPSDFCSDADKFCDNGVCVTQPCDWFVE